MVTIINIFTLLHSWLIDLRYTTIIGGTVQTLELCERSLPTLAHHGQTAKRIPMITQ